MTQTAHSPTHRVATSPNDIAAAMTGRPHVTYSEIRTFQACPLKWKFQYVDKVEPECLSAAMLLGSGVHAAVELHFQSLLAANDPPSIDEMMAAYDSSWRYEAERAPIRYSRGQDAETTSATARRMLETFASSPLAKPPGEIIGVEESFKVQLARDIPTLAGRVDMITFDRGAGDLTVTDFKTSRSVWSQGHAVDQAEQLILYAQGCEPIARDLGASIKLRYVIVTKTKQPKVDAVVVPFDRARIGRSLTIIRQVFRVMQAGTTYPVPSPMTCTGCQFKRQCVGWA